MHHRSILIVDDSRTNRDVLARRLAEQGYLVALAADGREALDMIAGRSFDLVLLDIIMPGLSGLDVLAEIRGDRQNADLPVVMVTGRSDAEAAVRALAGGADDHIAKPFTFDVLFARVARVLDRGRRLAELKRANAALDARIAVRAMELGEARSDLAIAHADRERLVASLAALHDEVTRLRGSQG